MKKWRILNSQTGRTVPIGLVEASTSEDALVLASNQLRTPRCLLQALPYVHESELSNRVTRKFDVTVRVFVTPVSKNETNQRITKVIRKELDKALLNSPLFKRPDYDLSDVNVVEV